MTLPQRIYLIAAVVACATGLHTAYAEWGASYWNAFELWEVSHPKMLDPDWTGPILPPMRFGFALDHGPDAWTWGS